MGCGGGGLITEKLGRGQGRGKIASRTPSRLGFSLIPPRCTFDSLLGLMWDFIKVVLRTALHFNLQILLAVLAQPRGDVQYVIDYWLIFNQWRYILGPHSVLPQNCNCLSTFKYKVILFAMTTHTHTLLTIHTKSWMWSDHHCSE